MQATSAAPLRVPRLVANVLATMLATLLVFLNIYGVLGPDGGGTVFTTILFLLAVAGIPLLLLLLGASIYLLVKRAGFRAVGKTWLVVVLAGALYPLGLLAGGLWQNHFDRNHPDIGEVHVNLSGRNVTIPDIGTLDGKSPETFGHGGRRTPDHDHSDWSAAYDGDQLASGFKSMNVFWGDPASKTPTALPVVAAGRPIKLPLMRGVFDSRNRSPVFLYYYYGDRVEVSTSFRAPDDIDDDSLRVFPHNLGALPIARLEIDDQGVALTQPVEKMDMIYCERKPGIALMNKLHAPIKVRWQYAQPNPVWHEARLAVPDYEGKTRVGGRIGTHELHLYLYPDGGSAAQRARKLERDGARTMQVTRVVPALTEAGERKIPECIELKFPNDSELAD